MQSDGRRRSDFEEMVQRHHHRIIAIAHRMLGNMEEAKDMAQDAFIRLWNHGNLPSEDAATFRLLARTVTNLCIDRLRHRKRRRHLSLEAASSNIQLASSDDPARSAGDRELVRLVMKKADQLKARQKAVFVLRDIEGYTVRETAEIIGCSENNVLVTLHQARKNLRKWLKSKLEEPAAGIGSGRKP
jgi:RNA polymerase sigma-70 factor (ECF subfamily)